MPIDSLHPEYEQWQPTWEKVRHFSQGEDVVKGKKDKYLESPSGISAREARFKLYLSMAKFFPAVSRALEGYEGLIFRNDLNVQVPDAMKGNIPNITYSGVSINSFARQVFCERMLMGRYGELVDYMPGDGKTLGRAFSKGYTAESIINWKIDHMHGVPRLSQVVLKEKRAKPLDAYTFEEYDVFRVLDLDPGYYHISEWMQNEKGEAIQVSDSIPDYNGQKITEIPFMFYGVRENSATVEKPPMLDMVNLVQHDFHNSADLEWGRHWVSIPQPWRAGFSDDESSTIEFGATTVWDTTNEKASAGMVEFSGAGLTALETAISENRTEMAQLGALLLEGEKKSVESASSYRARHSTRASFLQSMAEIQSEGHTVALGFHAAFQGIPESQAESISVELNKDFFAVQIDHNQIKAIMDLYLAGRISKHTLFERLQSGEIIGSGEDFDEYESSLSEENVGMDDADLDIGATG